MRHLFNSKSYLRVVFSLLILLILSLFNPSLGQVIFDGVNCNATPNTYGTGGEWNPADAIVDIDDPALSIPVSSDIDSLWFLVEDFHLYFAFNRAGAATGGAGNAGFKFLFNTDCDVTTGKTAFGGADVALFFSIQSGVVQDSAIYKWNGSTFQTSGYYFTPLIGGTSCSDSANGRFFEFKVHVADIYDVCSGHPCGGLTLTAATVHAGGSFNSIIKDTLLIDIDVFINDPPVTILDPIPDTICSGDIITFDASASTENYSINTPYDSIVTFEWDMNYNASNGFVPTTGYTGKIVQKAFYGTSAHNVAIRTTDIFGCRDTIYVTFNSYDNPTPFILQDYANQDSCYEVVYNGKYSTGYSTNTVLTYFWEFPDATTSNLDSLVKVYSMCAYGYTEPVKLTVTDNIGCSSWAVITTPVPIELLYFKGRLVDHKVELNWQTASEINNDHFDIERSYNGIDFNSIAQVPGKLNSMTITDYTYTDEQKLLFSAYYRLRQVDVDGATTFYGPILIQGPKAKSDLVVSPNPSTGKITITPHFDKQDFNILILDKCGRVILNKEYLSMDYNQRIDLDMKGYENGMYFVIAGNEAIGFKHQLLVLID